MPRHPPHFLPGGAYHVYWRGARVVSRMAGNGDDGHDTLLRAVDPEDPVGRWSPALGVGLEDILTRWAVESRELVKGARHSAIVGGSR